MFNELLMVLGGLALIIKGGDFFVAAAIRLAESLRMPRVVIGSTLVNLATTTPELVVSIMAGLRGEAGLAVGNAVGSCICNIGLIAGVTAVIKQVDVNFRVLCVPLFVMFGCGLVLFLMTLDLSLERWQGGLLLTGGLAVIANAPNPAGVGILHSAKVFGGEGISPLALFLGALRPTAVAVVFFWVLH